MLATFPEAVEVEQLLACLLIALEVVVVVTAKVVALHVEQLIVGEEEAQTKGPQLVIALPLPSMRPYEVPLVQYQYRNRPHIR